MSFFTDTTAVKFTCIDKWFNVSSVFLQAGTFSIRWYGVIIAFGLTLAVLFGGRTAYKWKIDINKMIDVLIYGCFGGIIGARAYYVIFNFEAYKADTLLEMLKKMVNIRNGGLAIYGAVIAAVITVTLFCKRKKIAVGDMLDVGAFGLLIGQCVGRWGNFINREAFGAETSVPWKMGLTYTSGKTIYVHPTFFYESLWNFIGFLIISAYSKKHRKFSGQIFALYAVWYGIGRFFIEWLRVNTDSLLLINTPDFKLPISVCVAAASAIAGAIFLAVKSKKTKTDAIN